MPACVAMTILAMAGSPPMSTSFTSPFSSEANGSWVCHSGCCGASTFTRSRAKRNWKYIGCSLQSVPSLSKTAMRSATGTKSPPPSLVTRLTKSMMADFAGPSFQDSSESAQANRTATDCSKPRPRTAARANARQRRGNRASRCVKRRSPPPLSRYEKNAANAAFRAQSNLIQSGSAAAGLFQIFDDVIEIESGRPLPGRIVLERCQELPRQRLRRHEQEGMPDGPFIVSVGRDIRPLVGVHPQIEHLGKPQAGKGLGPNPQRTFGALLAEDHFPVLVPQRDELAVVIEIEERLARRLGFLAFEIGEDVETVEMVLVGHIAELPALQQAIRHVSIAGRRQQRREPIERGDDLVGYLAGLDMARPADRYRHAESAFPVAVLFVAERRHAAIGPRVHMRPVVRGIEDGRVVGDAEIVERLQELSDIAVMLEHAVEIFADAALPEHLRPYVGVEMHPGRVHPCKERLAGLDLPLHEVDGGRG